MQSNHARIALAVLTAWTLVAGLAIGGCDRSLFPPDDKAATDRLQYFSDNSSAVEERANRRENANMGFGYPTGPGSQ